MELTGIRVYFKTPVATRKTSRIALVIGQARPRGYDILP
jgi:hypothetical protein